MKTNYDELSFFDYMLESNIDDISNILKVDRNLVAIAITSQRLKLHSNGLLSIKYY